MLENTEGAIKNGQSRETGNKGYTKTVTHLDIATYQVNISKDV
jgi:hypothetical protein